MKRSWWQIGLAAVCVIAVLAVAGTRVYLKQTGQTFGDIWERKKAFMETAAPGSRKAIEEIERSADPKM